MSRFNKKSNLYITLAIVTILLIGLGYAFLTSNLNIIGNTNINKNTWGVEFENINVTQGSVEASTPTISNKTTVNYTVTLDKPGDYYEFTVDAVNKGSIDAMIDAVSNTGLTTEQKKYLTYTATYSDGTEVKPKQELKAEAREKMLVRVEYKKDITAEDLPSENQQLTLTFSIEYVQKDDSSEPVEHPVCRRATTLHTETCSQTGTTGCKSSAETSSSITYGSKGTAGTLTAGDAFDCDVNGDGTFNSTNERFYYISSLDTDSNYAVLIYYNNVSGGSPNNTTSYAYDSSASSSSGSGSGSGSGSATSGPKTAKLELPTTSQWKGVSLSNTTRNIKDENRAVKVSNFSYSGYAARLLTYQEVVSACGGGTPTYTGYLDTCKYLMENTYYSSGSLKNGWWLENPNSSHSDNVWHVYYGRCVTNSNASFGYYNGVRPAIEVPKSKISY